MAREFVCPRCGTTVPLDPPPDPPPTEGSTALSQTVETLIPRTICLDVGHPKGSGGPAIWMAAAEPDGEATFRAGDGFPLPSGSLDGVPATSPPDPSTVETPRPEAVPFPAIELGRAPDPAPDSVETAEHGLGMPAPRPTWGRLLLASYASALTLGLGWLFWTGRVGPGGVTRPTLPHDSRPDLGGKGVALAPLDPERTTTLGRPLRLGRLEVTPLEVKAAPVTLVAADGAAQRAGGAGALWLRLRLRNLATDATYAPLEPALVREPDRGLPDCLVDLGDGRTIGPFPLATESEWAIVGQDFAPLRPGEEREAVAVSAPEAALGSAAMIWRLRVRTGPGQTELIGIEFRPADVH